MQCRNVPRTRSVPLPRARLQTNLRFLRVPSGAGRSPLGSRPRTSRSSPSPGPRSPGWPPESSGRGSQTALWKKEKENQAAPHVLVQSELARRSAETCSRANSRGRSRGVEEGSVHQGAVITVLEQVIGLAGQAAVRGFVDHRDLHRVFGVVEVHHVDVEDQNGRAGDDPSCGGRTERRWDGARERARTQARGSPTPVSP